MMTKVNQTEEIIKDNELIVKTQLFCFGKFKVVVRKYLDPSSKMVNIQAKILGPSGFLLRVAEENLIERACELASQLDSHY